MKLPEQEFVEKLIKKYGPDGFVQMARDSRLNPFQVLSPALFSCRFLFCFASANAVLIRLHRQLTPTQIRKKVEKYNKYIAELSARGVQNHAANRSAATRLPCDTWNVYPKIC